MSRSVSLEVKTMDSVEHMRAQFTKVDAAMLEPGFEQLARWTVQQLESDEAARGYADHLVEAMYAYGDVHLGAIMGRDTVTNTAILGAIRWNFVNCVLMLKDHANYRDDMARVATPINQRDASGSWT